MKDTQLWYTDCNISVRKYIWFSRTLAMYTQEAHCSQSERPFMHTIVEFIIAGLEVKIYGWVWQQAWLGQGWKAGMEDGEGAWIQVLKV